MNIFTPEFSSVLNKLYVDFPLDYMNVVYFTIGLLCFHLRSFLSSRRDTPICIRDNLDNIRSQKRMLRRNRLPAADKNLIPSVSEAQARKSSNAAFTPRTPSIAPGTPAFLRTKFRAKETPQRSQPEMYQYPKFSFSESTIDFANTPPLPTGAPRTSTVKSVVDGKQTFASDVARPSSVRHFMKRMGMIRKPSKKLTKDGSTPATPRCSIDVTTHFKGSLAMETVFGTAIQIFDHDWFVAASTAAKESQKYGCCVTIFTKKQLKKCSARMFVSENLGAFAAVTQMGELINVVRHRDRSSTQDFYSVITATVCSGANFLECMDTITVPVYLQCGFIPVAKVKWNDDYAPEDWDKQLFAKFNGGEPYYMYMVYAGDQERVNGIQAWTPRTAKVSRETYYSKYRAAIPTMDSKAADRTQRKAVKTLYGYVPRKVADADALETRKAGQN